MSLHSYHSRQTPGMSVSVDVGKNRIHCKFENHLYQTDDDAIAEAIDSALKVSSALSRAIGKIDKVAAEETLIAAMKVEQAKNQGVLGAGGTGVLDNMEQQKPTLANPTQNFSETGVGNTVVPVAQPAIGAQPALGGTPETPNELPLDAPPSEAGAGVLPPGAVPAEVPTAPALNLSSVPLKV